MWLEGIPVADRAILQLAPALRDAELIDTAERLERASDREPGSSATGRSKTETET